MAKDNSYLTSFKIDLVRQVMEGHELKAVAAKYGVSKSTLWGWKCKYGQMVCSEWKLREKGRASDGDFVDVVAPAKETAEVYRWYKKRWRPETYFDVLKNHMDFAELGLRDCYEIQGLAFVAVVVDQIRRRVWEKVSSLKKGYSLPEYLLKMRGVKVHRNSSS